MRLIPAIDDTGELLAEQPAFRIKGKLDGSDFASIRLIPDFADEHARELVDCHVA